MAEGGSKTLVGGGSGIGNIIRLYLSIWPELENHILFLQAEQRIQFKDRWCLNRDVTQDKKQHQQKALRMPVWALSLPTQKHSDKKQKTRKATISTLIKKDYIIVLTYNSHRQKNQLSAELAWEGSHNTVTADSCTADRNKCVLGDTPTSPNPPKWDSVTDSMVVVGKS